MSTDVASGEKTVRAYGAKHWLLQIIPPSLMLGVLFSTTRGTSLVFIAGFLALPVLISLISIIVKLTSFRRRKYFLVRPLLTIAVFILIFVIADRTYHSALEQAVDEAREIHRHCNETGLCPEHPAGWQRNGSRLSKSDFGVWFTYVASYSSREDLFELRLYRGPDTGDVISGGSGVPFTLAPRAEN